jgi:hypothetical protein
MALVHLYVHFSLYPYEFIASQMKLENWNRIKFEEEAV